MVGRVRRLVRHLGFDVAPFPGAAPHWARLGELLLHNDISLVFDVGANAGQYGRAIRNNGYRQRIVSYEPTAKAHAGLVRETAHDAAWVAVPACAVGDADQPRVEIRASAESDMSSLLPMTGQAKTHMPTAAETVAETVPMVTLASELPAHAKPDDRLFLKVDTQGYEDRVLDGLGSRIDELTGLQLELGLQPIYDGQPGFITLIQRVADAGFEAAFVVPGYYSRHFRRMIDFDMVWFRP